MFNSLQTENLLGVSSLQKEDVREVFRQARELFKMGNPLLKNFIVATVFWGGGHAKCDAIIAAKKLGASVVDMAPDEEIEDEPLTSILASLSYVDVHVVRHQKVMSLIQVRKPIVAAGDGGGENYPQALTALHALEQQWEEDEISNKCVVLSGDLMGCGTAHSLAMELARQGVGELVLCAPEGREMSDWVLGYLIGKTSVRVERSCDHAVCQKADAIYYVRIPKWPEHDPRDYYRRYGHCLPKPDTFIGLRPGTVVLHSKEEFPHFRTGVSGGREELSLSEYSVGIWMALLCRAVGVSV